MTGRTNASAGNLIFNNTPSHANNAKTISFAATVGIVYVISVTYLNANVVAVLSVDSGAQILAPSLGAVAPNQNASRIVILATSNQVTISADISLQSPIWRVF